MASPGPMLGLDIGDVRIGVAVCDPLGIVATPHSFIAVESAEADAERIAAIVREYQAVRIVAGLPLDRQGQSGHQAQKVLQFLETLRNTLDIDIVTQDERFSSASAERVLIEANVRRKGRKKVIDKLAAQQILQTYLDRAANERARRQ